MIPSPQIKAKLWKASQPLIAILLGSMAAYSSAFDFGKVSSEHTPSSLDVYDVECSDDKSLFDSLSLAVKGKQSWIPFSAKDGNNGLTGTNQQKLPYHSSQLHSEMVQPESISLAALALLSLSLILGRSKSARRSTKHR